MATTPSPAEQKQLAQARAHLAQASRLMRDRGHADLAADADQIAADLQAKSAPAQRTRTAPASATQHALVGTLAARRRRASDATATQPPPAALPAQSA